MQTIYQAYDQLAELLAKLEPNEVASIKASKAMQERFDSLVKKMKEASLSLKEKDELDHFLVLERLVRLAKLKAEEQGSKL